MSRRSKTGGMGVKAKPIPCSICDKPPHIINNVSDVSVVCPDHITITDETEEEAVAVWNYVNGLNSENTERKDS